MKDHSLETLIRDAKAGDPSAQYNLAALFPRERLKHFDVPLDFKKTLTLFRKSAEQGNITAQFRLALVYQRGTSDVSVDLKTSFTLFLKAAEQGHPLAQCFVALCLVRGEGIEKDSKAAFPWFLKAAKQGHPRAQIAVAECLYKGEGTAKDSEASSTWFLEAEKQGASDARLVRNESFPTPPPNPPKGTPSAEILYRVLLTQYSPSKKVTLPAASKDELAFRTSIEKLLALGVDVNSSLRSLKGRENEEAILRAMNLHLGDLSSPSHFVLIAARRGYQETLAWLIREKGARINIEETLEGRGISNAVTLSFHHRMLHLLGHLGFDFNTPNLFSSSLLRGADNDERLFLLQRIDPQIVINDIRMNPAIWAKLAHTHATTLADHNPEFAPALIAAIETLRRLHIEVDYREILDELNKISSSRLPTPPL